MKRAIIRAVACGLFAAMPLSAQVDTTILRPTTGGFIVDYVQQDMRNVFQALALAGEISISIAANVPQNQRITLRLPTPVPKEGLLDLLTSLVTDNQLTIVQNATTGVYNISRPMPQPGGRGNQAAAAAQASATDLSVYVLNLRHLNNITLAQILNGVFSAAGRGGNFNFLNQQGRQNQPARGAAGGARGGGGGGGGGGGRGGGGGDDDELQALTSAVQSQLVLDPSTALTAIYDPETIAELIRQNTTPQDVRRINAQIVEQQQQQGRGGGGRGGQAQGQAAGVQAALGALQVLTGGAAAQQQQQQPVIVPTEGTNQIIVRATPADFALIQALVQTIDLRPLQVLIEVSIVEVTRSNDLNVGVSGTASRTRSGGDTSALVTLNRPTTFDNARDFVLELAGGRGTVDFNIAINALATRGDVTVASLPVIFAQNNRQAQLIVGEQRPFVANTSLIPNDNGIVNQVIQYRDVATTLLITPTINADGYVNMDVDQSIQNVTSEVQLDAPVISSRRAVTSLFVKSGQTAVIGGLTSNSKSRTRTGIPFLSKIPIIGAIFGATRNSDLISEMYLFLTPHVVQTDQDTDRLTQAVKQSSDLVKNVPLKQIIQPDPAIRVIIPPDTGSLTRIPQRVDTAGARGRGAGAGTDTTGGRGGRSGRGGRGGGVDTLMIPRGSFKQ